MRTYLISYDIPGHHRHALANAVMQLGEAWARPLESTWYVQATDRADSIERRLRPFAEAAEGLIIQEVDAKALVLNTALRWFRRRGQAVQVAGEAHAPAAPAAPIALAA